MHYPSSVNIKISIFKMDDGHSLTKILSLTFNKHNKRSQRYPIPSFSWFRGDKTACDIDYASKANKNYMACHHNVFL